MNIRDYTKRYTIILWSLTYLFIKFLPHVGHVTYGFRTYRACVSTQQNIKTKKVLIFVYQWLALKDLRDFFYRLCNPISLVHCKCIVWPHLKTVISLVESNRYWKQKKTQKSRHCYVTLLKKKFSGYDSFTSKQTGQLWCIAPSTHRCLSSMTLE